MKWIAGAILAVIILGAGGLYLRGQIPFTKPYKAIVELAPKSERDYTQRFVGTFQRIDRERGTLVLESLEGKTYYFGVPMAMIENNDADLSIPIGTKVQVAWRDSESMEQILSRYSQDPTAPVNSEASSLSISQIK